MNPADLFKSFPSFPTLLCVLLLLPFAARTLSDSRVVRLGRVMLAVAVIAAASLSLALAFANLAVPDYVDNVEPTVAGNAWIWWHGGALYPGIDAATGTAELRGLLYGPLTFLVNGIAPMLGGASVFVSKLPPLGMFLGMAALTGWACRRAGASPLSAFLAAAAMVAVLGISEAPYWVRADTILMLIGALSVWLVARPARHTLGLAVLLGVLAGTASGMKLHGAAYVAPACLIAVLDAARWPLGNGPPTPLDWKRGLLAAVLIGLAALAAVAWPFLLPGISLAHYAFYLGLATHHGFSGVVFLGNLSLLLGICLPLLVLALDAKAEARRWGGARVLAPRWLVLAAAAFGCAVLVALIAGKPGAGYPHLLPFLPYAAMLAAQIIEQRQRRGEAAPGRISVRFLVTGALFCVAFCAPVLVRTVTFATRGAAFAEIGDGVRQIRQVMQAHPGQVVAVGYGGDSFLDIRLSYLRIVPVFDGQPLLYDATAMDDLWQGGVDRAIALRGLDGCGVQVWLVPGERPFSISNYYGGHTFSDEFRSHFAARYSQEASGGPFHVWVCHPAR